MNTRNLYEVFCRYLKVPLFKKKLAKIFGRKPSQRFFCRYLKVPLFKRKKCTPNPLPLGSRPPPKKKGLSGGGLCHQIIFSILRYDPTSKYERYQK